MATYQYDDFRLTLIPRAQGDYDMRAVTGDGSEHVGRFRIPLSEGALEQAVLSLARAGQTRRANGAGRSVVDERSTRDVGGDGPPRLSAQQLGVALADALLRDDIGRGYEQAAARAAERGHGLRLSLSLADAPALLHLPWEFLYRRPRFLASQRHSPLVRHLDTGSLAPPPSIESTVRMLGVIATPVDLGPLDVAAERRRVERALTRVVAMGRVELEWLDPATPRRLRQALRDDSFHIVHFVGHSSFTNGGEGVLFLESEADQRADALDSTALANLLSDQTRLRLVVLNSCEGARTTLADPYAGVATTLIQLGVPAVVAMQFEISDRAAIVFAEELYTNLIGRQDPIDAAVAEARKAVYIEVDKVEWATPVLFVRHPDVELFRFAVPAAPLPPTMPPGAEEDETVELADSEVGGSNHHQLTGRGDDEAVAAGSDGSRRTSRRRWLVAGAVTALAVGALAVVSALMVFDDDGGGDPDDTVPVGPQNLDEPRPRSGFIALQIAELEGDTHLYQTAPDSEDIEPVTDDPDVLDTQPVWDRRFNRLAFTRDFLDDDDGSRIWYVVPPNGDEHPGTIPAELIDWEPGADFKHFPAWAPDGALWYMAGGDCEPGPDCEEELWRATFTASDEGEGFATEYTSRDLLQEGSDDLVAEGFTGVRAVAADPFDPSRAAVVDTTGLHLVDIGNETQTVVTSPNLELATFTSDGQQLVVTTRDGGDSAFLVHDRNGTGLQENRVDDLDPDGTLAESLGRSVSGVEIISMTSNDVDQADYLLAVFDDPTEDLAPAVAEMYVDDAGLMSVNQVFGSEPAVGLLGQLQAIAY